MGFRTLRYENEKKLKKEQRFKIVIFFLCIVILCAGLYVVDTSVGMFTDKPNIKLINYEFYNNTYNFSFFDDYTVALSKDDIRDFLYNIKKIIKDGTSYLQGILNKISNKLN